jgi:hypothetical protein
VSNYTSNDVIGYFTSIAYTGTEEKVGAAESGRRGLNAGCKPLGIYAGRPSMKSGAEIPDDPTGKGGGIPGEACQARLVGQKVPSAWSAGYSTGAAFSLAATQPD